MYADTLAKDLIHNTAATSPTTFDSVRQIQAVASTVAKNQVLPTNVAWDRDFTTVCVNGTNVNMITMRSGNDRWQRELKQLACKLARCSEPEQHIFIPSSLHIAHGTGGSILDLPELACYKGASNPILRLWMEDLAMTPDGKSWNPVKMAELLEMSGRFWGSLSGFLFVVSGPPSRGTDYTDLTHRDSYDPPGLVRRLDQWVLNIRHHKLESHSMSSFHSAAYVPAPVAQLLSWAIGVLRPAEIVVARQLYGLEQATVYNQYLFVDRGNRIKSDTFSTLLKHYTGEHWTAPLGLQDYRQLSAALVSAFIPQRDMPKGILAADPGNQMMGHGDDTTNIHYAREHDNGALPVQVDWEHRVISSQWRCIMLPDYEHPPPRPLRSLQGFYDPQIGIDTARDGHSSFTREGIEDIVSRAVAAANQANVNAFRDMLSKSSQNHFEAMEEIFDQRGMHLPRAGQDVAANNQALAAEQALGFLRETVGDPTAQFRPGQKELFLRTLSNHKQHILCVHPCGSGKSLAFMVPAKTFQADKVHVVIEPYVSLIVQFSAQAMRLGIPAINWGDWTVVPHGVAVPTRGLVFATPEAALSPSFQK